ncbi:hypothetical protein IFM89_036545 [Coptis chinensis]|uniref:Uncharacterized protein n=1 Tax=Coptis chinensis TaxID=261450 RepID=A0A835HJ28_9MAGN|nr:hypothetical protein IFM89_036545 [Coptis chinensis]
MEDGREETPFPMPFNLASAQPWPILCNRSDLIGVVVRKLCGEVMGIVVNFLLTKLGFLVSPLLLSGPSDSMANGKLLEKLSTVWLLLTTLLAVAYSRNSMGALPLAAAAASRCAGGAVDEKIECCRFLKDGSKPFLFCTVQKGDKVVSAVWDINTWNRIGHKRLLRKPAAILSISWDGKYLALGSKDGDLFVVEVKKMEISHCSKRLHPRVATPHEKSSQAFGCDTSVGVSGAKSSNLAINYHEPSQARPKGCGKRLKGDKEKALKKAQKYKRRRCNGCNMVGVSHDKRNCPELKKKGKEELNNEEELNNGEKTCLYDKDATYSTTDDDSYSSSGMSLD